MTRAILITIALLLSGCAPALQGPHSEVYSRYIPVSGMSEAQWDGDKFKGNCAAFAKEVLRRADAAGLDAEYVVVRKLNSVEEILAGNPFDYHAVVMVVEDGQVWVSDSWHYWVYSLEWWEKLGPKWIVVRRE